jgi:hypothetical protein
MDRACASEAQGRRFESARARHPSLFPLGRLVSKGFRSMWHSTSPATALADYRLSRLTIANTFRPRVASSAKRQRKQADSPIRTSVQRSTTLIALGNKAKLLRAQLISPQREFGPAGLSCDRSWRTTRLMSVVRGLPITGRETSVTPMSSCACGCSI